MWWHFGNLRAKLNHCIMSSNFSDHWLLQQNSLLHWRILPVFPVAGSGAWEWPFITIRFLSATSARERARVDQMLSLSFDILNNKPPMECFFSTCYALQTCPSDISQAKDLGASVRGLKSQEWKQFCCWRCWGDLTFWWCLPRASFLSTLMLFCVFMRNVNSDWLFLSQKAVMSRMPVLLLNVTTTMVWGPVPWKCPAVIFCEPHEVTRFKFWINPESFLVMKNAILSLSIGTMNVL